MPVLKQGVAVTQDDPLLKVDNKLEAGRHRFQLEVIDSAGLVSEPAVLVVTVSEPAPPPTPTPTRATIDPRILTRVTPTPTLNTRLVTPVTIRKPK